MDGIVYANNKIAVKFKKRGERERRIKERDMAIILLILNCFWIEVMSYKIKVSALNAPSLLRL